MRWSSSRIQGGKGRGLAKGWAMSHALTHHAGRHCHSGGGIASQYPRRMEEVWELRRTTASRPCWWRCGYRRTWPHQCTSEVSWSATVLACVRCHVPCSHCHSLLSDSCLGLERYWHWGIGYCPIFSSIGYWAILLLAVIPNTNTAWTPWYQLSADDSREIGEEVR